MEQQKKRVYFEPHHVLTAEEERRTIYSRLDFSLSPFLSDTFLNEITLTDRIKLIKATTAKQLWLFARLHRLEVTANSIKPCGSGADYVDVCDKNVIQKKHTEWLLAESVSRGELLHRPPMCVVVHDDRVPSLAVFDLSDAQLTALLTTCSGTSAEHCTDSIIKRTFADSFEWKWRNGQRSRVVPYNPCAKNGSLLLSKVIWDCTDSSLRWRGVFDPALIYVQGDTVGFEMYFYMFVGLNYFHVLQLGVDATKEEIAKAFTKATKAKSPLAQEAYDALIKSKARTKYIENLTKLKSSHHWKLLPQKPAQLLQVVEVLPVAEYERVFGTPRCEAEKPFTFDIAGEPYYDTPMTFYVQSPRLEDYVK